MNTSPGGFPLPAYSGYSVDRSRFWLFIRGLAFSSLGGAAVAPPASWAGGRLRGLSYSTVDGCFPPAVPRNLGAPMSDRSTAHHGLSPRLLAARKSHGRRCRSHRPGCQAAKTSRRTPMPRKAPTAFRASDHRPTTLAPLPEGEPVVSNGDYTLCTQMNFGM